MKVRSCAILALAAETVAASTCRIYTRDLGPRPDRNTKSATLSTLATRLVLAHRVGVEEYHRADLPNGEVIDAINDYGAWTPLLDPIMSQGDIIYLVEDKTGRGVGSMYGLDALPSFEVSPAPNTNAFHDLLGDIKTQYHAQQAAQRKEEYGSDSVGSNETLQIVMGDLAAMARDFWKSEPGMSATIIVTNSAKAGEVQWGSYEMPDAVSQLRKRTRQTFEAPLELDEEASHAHDADGSMTSKKGDNKTVYGILPACFNTKDACISTTKNCTGRGECYLKYTDPDAKDSAVNKHCYTCGCRPTVEKNDQGQTLTTNWGGPACQKKDVSVQFWLIALFSVGLMSLVSFAIGSIWSVGNEDLPSVIGAGVSGPVRR